MTYADFKAAVERSGGTVQRNLTEDGYRVAAEVDSRRYVFLTYEDTDPGPTFERHLRTIRNVLRGHGYPVATEREDPSVNYNEVD